MKWKRMASRFVSTLALTILAHSLSAAAMDSPDIDDAFAIVQRNGEAYAPFYTYYITPHAFVENGRVFTAHQDGEGRPIAMAYDIDRKSWEGPLRASDFGLGSDTHGNPSICIDRNGRIHLFFGCHGREMKYVRSVRPYDITQWEEMPSPTPRATYPETVRMADGRLFLFYRAGGHMQPWSLRISEDDGETWSDAERIVELRIDPPDPLAAAYCTFLPGADGRTIHGFFVHKDDNPGRRPNDPHPWRPLRFPGLHEAVYRYNVYYILREADGTWRAADGTAFEPPLSKAAADRHALVYDTGHEFARHKRIVIDENDRPYLRFEEGVTDWTSGRVLVPPRTLFTAPDEGRWHVWAELPDAWPEDVRRQIMTEGPAAAGEEFPNPWFIGYFTGPRGDGTASYVYLGHTERGYAKRERGPTPAP